MLKLLGLDVGEKRIGLALGDSAVKIAFPKGVVNVDGGEIEAISRIIKNDAIDIVIIGYPRNQKGETTLQTKFVEDFASRLKNIFDNLKFQDESLTSVIAEQRLVGHKKAYSKSDIDSQAATIILQDYIEENYA